MQSITQYIKAYSLCEYLLVLKPHDDLWNKIKKIKEEFFEKYQSAYALQGKPHLTLVKFHQREIMEDRVIRRLQNIALGFHPIKVELKDFGSFPSHTIYITVPTKEPIRELTREIKMNRTLLKGDKDHPPHFMDEPHFTIARKLLPWQFEQGWLEYSHRSFTSRFIADSMLLLKRRQGDKAYQIVRRFEFMNMPVSTVQGSLFA